MDNGIQVFNYNDDNVRTVLRDGDPWFSGKDVCAVFGDTNHNRSLSRVLEEDKLVLPVETSAGIRNAIFINETGLYDLLFSMQPQKANNAGVQDAYPKELQDRIDRLADFRRWVTHEVLPSIRKHGMYATPAKIEDMLADPDTMIATLQALKSERAARTLAEAKLVEQKPKVVFADSVVSSKTSILIGELAKLLRQNGVEVGQNRLFDWMRREGWLIKKGNARNMPTQRSMEMGLMDVTERTIDNPDGSIMITRTTKITGKGQVYFINKIIEDCEIWGG